MWCTSCTSVTPSDTRPASTRPAPARMSVATTGALESRSRPRTTAWCPSMRTLAPSRTSSLANTKRASNTFSVIRAVPVDTAARATAIGCRSVGKPGYGSVTTSTHRGHDEVLRRADRREVQPDARAGQPRRRGDQEAVLAHDRGAEPLETGDVH